jgi:trehalose 6-phosphate phosphatase
VADVLTRLRATLGVVAIVSGRPVDFLQSHLPAGLELHGLYGLESVVDGAPSHHPAGAAWPAVVDEVVADARASGPDGMDVEHKGLSLTLHFRRRPEVADAVATWADGAAERSGLLVRPAKMSLELHPPVSVDKGSVVESRAEGCTAVAYVGDDEGDLPAFAALDRLARGGTDTVKVAVRTPDASPALLAAADLQVDGPVGAVELLRTLLP